FCKIGAHAFTAVNSVVVQDIPPYIMAQGHNAVPRTINSEGLKRRGFTPQQITAIKRAYKLLYRQGLTVAEAVKKMRELNADEELTPLIGFILSSKRGIIRSLWIVDVMTTAPLIAVIAGEHSGDLLGAGMLRELRQRYPTAEFIGVGGPLMQAEGLQSLVSMDDLAVMGVAEVLGRLPTLLRHRRLLIST